MVLDLKIIPYYLYVEDVGPSEISYIGGSNVLNLYIDILRDLQQKTNNTIKYVNPA